MYDAQCVNKERKRQGDNFSWGITDPNFVEGGIVEVIEDGQIVEKEVKYVEKEEDMPDWMKLAFVISFGINFLGILICTACCCRRKQYHQKKEFSKFQDSRSATWR